MKSITVQEALDLPVFRGKYRILAGRAGLLRQVNWAHVIEVNGPDQESAEHILVLTTGVSWNTPERALGTLQAMIRGGAAALCIDTATYFNQIPQEMVDLAEQNGFPLIIFPFEMRFGDITREINTMVVEKSNGIWYNQNRWIGHWLCGDLHSRAAYQQLRELYLLNRRMDVTIGVCWGEADSPDCYSQLSLMVRRCFLTENITALTYCDDGKTILLLISPHGVDHLHQALRRCFGQLHTHPVPGFPIEATVFALGRTVDFDQGPKSSYESAIFALASQDNFANKELLIDYEALYTAQLFEYFRQANPTFLDGFIQDHLGSLLLAENEVLLSTLRVFYDCGCTKQEAAAQLFIARQSLYSRLERIEELIGSDFDKQPRRLAIEFAINAHTYLALRRPMVTK